MTPIKGINLKEGLSFQRHTNQVDSLVNEKSIAHGVEKCRHQEYPIQV
jgi:hypothetical protein